MEGHLWSWIVRWLPVAEECRGRKQFETRTIVMVVLWAVLQDRPMNWACQPENWPERFRPERLPSPSTLSRRWRQPAMVAQAQAALRQSLNHLGGGTRDGVLDARPLVVGGGSQDPDAKAGRAVGHLAKGHKLFALMNANRAVVSFLIGAMSDSEPTQARRLLAEAPATMQRIVADGVYDSVPLHRVAQIHHRRLYTPLRQGRVGRRQQPQRVRLWKILQHAAGQALLHARDAIERAFGLMSNFACGFKGLPSWARRHHRVHRWMWGKILVYHAYLIHSQNLHTAAA